MPNKNTESSPAPPTATAPAPPTPTTASRLAAAAARRASNEARDQLAAVATGRPSLSSRVEAAEQLRALRLAEKVDRVREREGGVVVGGGVGATEGEVVGEAEEGEGDREEGVEARVERAREERRERARRSLDDVQAGHARAEMRAAIRESEVRSECERHEAEMAAALERHASAVDKIRDKQAHLQNAAARSSATTLHEQPLQD